MILCQVDSYTETKKTLVFYFNREIINHDDLIINAHVSYHIVTAFTIVISYWPKDYFYYLVK